MDWEHILLVLAAVLGTGGIGGLLGYRVQARKQKADAWTSEQQERRGNFEAIVETLQEEMKRLKAEGERERELRVRAEEKAEANAKELAEHRGRTEARIDQLEKDNERLAREMAALTARVCPWGRVDCPRVARAGA